MTRQIIIAVVGVALPFGSSFAESVAPAPPKTPNAKITSLQTYFHYNWFSEVVVRLNDRKKLKRGCWGEVIGLEKPNTFVIQREFHNDEGWTVLQALTATLLGVGDTYRKAHGITRTIDNARIIDSVWVSCTPLKPFKLNPAITWVKKVRGGVDVAINRGTSVGVEARKCTGSIDGVAGSSFVIKSVKDGDKAFATIQLGADKVKTGARVTLTCNP
ncbi:MAG: hypothetical protein HYY84_12635 [Deltaproteobacteria bacterium]|nr:hypothetical protein [Deltaproteobacteria bacterium]